MNKTQINKDLELLRKMWGIEKLQTPFIARHELDKFWEKRKEIEELAIDSGGRTKDDMIQVLEDNYNWCKSNK